MRRALLKMARFGGFFFAMILSASAISGEFTASAGASQFTHHGDGIWYQEPFPHQLNMRSPSIGLRYDTTQNDSGLSYGAGYQHLGRVSSDAEAVALDGKQPGDGGYNSATKSCNGPCWPLSHWRGSGDVQGFFGLVSKHYQPWAVEAGLYLYRPRWEVNIPDWLQCRECPPRNLTVTHNAKWQVGPMFGIRWKQNAWSLNFSVWQTASRGDEWTSLYHNFTFNLSAGYSW